MRGAASDVAAANFILRGQHSNPGASGGPVSFTLPDATPTTLELYDVAGRRVWSRDVGSLGAGEHAVPLADGASLPRGVYLARLVRGREVATIRMAIVR
jgi:hypothetical protein